MQCFELLLGIGKSQFIKHAKAVLVQFSKKIIQAVFTIVTPLVNFYILSMYSFQVEFSLDEYRYWYLCIQYICVSTHDETPFLLHVAILLDVSHILLHQLGYLQVVLQRNRPPNCLKSTLSIFIENDISHYSINEPRYMVFPKVQ